MKPTSAPQAPLSVSSAQGGRPHQEDRQVHRWMDLSEVPHGQGWLFGVFDGHGGAVTSEKASQAAGNLFRSALGACRGEVPEAFRQTFLGLNQLTFNDASGSTASLIYVPTPIQTAYWAVLGDSPVALVDSRGKLRVGPDHNIRRNLAERRVAERFGGVYYGGYLEDPQIPGRGVQMTRCLGDHFLRRVLGRDPELETIPLAAPFTLLAATDGILDGDESSTGDQLSRLFKTMPHPVDADAFVQDALGRQTGDNVTVIVWNESGSARPG